MESFWVCQRLRQFNMTIRTSNRGLCEISFRTWNKRKLRESFHWQLQTLHKVSFTVSHPVLMRRTCLEEKQQTWRMKRPKMNIWWWSWSAVPANNEMYKKINTKSCYQDDDDDNVSFFFCAMCIAPNSSFFQYKKEIKINWRKVNMDKDLFGFSCLNISSSKVSDNRI